MERKVKHLIYSYYVEEDSTVEPDKKVLVERFAYRGDTVDIPRDQDVKRGDRQGAFYSEEELANESGETTSSLEDLEPAEMTDEQLEEWVRTTNPTVPQMVDASQDDPELAQRLLDAEDRVTGGDTRKGVKEGLGAIVSQGNK